MSRTLNRASVAAATLLALMALTSPAGAQRAAGRVTSPAKGAGTGTVNDRLMGVSLGVHTVAAPGVSINGPDVGRPVSTGFGTGAGVSVAYGFTPVFSAFALLDVAKQPSSVTDIEGSFGLVHFQIGARANLPRLSPNTIPYVSASFGRRAVGARVTDFEFEEEYDVSFSGTMFGVGAGLQHFWSPTMALEGALDLGLGAFSHVSDDGEEFDWDVNGSTTVRLRIGMSWRP